MLLNQLLLTCKWFELHKCENVIKSTVIKSDIKMIQKTIFIWSIVFGPVQTAKIFFSGAWDVYLRDELVKH
jgi:hypothetical protein